MTENVTYAFEKLKALTFLLASIGWQSFSADIRFLDFFALEVRRFVILRYVFFWRILCDPLLLFVFCLR